MADHCCEMMRYNVEYTCDVHPDRGDCPDCLVDYWETSSRYVLLIRNEAGGGGIVIAYCPWCGTKLPEPTDNDAHSSSSS
jgi:hypothetical protein